MTAHTKFFEAAPDFSDLAKATGKFVIRLHDTGVFSNRRWFLYLPDGTRYELPTHKAALRIALNQIEKNRAKQAKLDVTPLGDPKLWNSILQSVHAPVASRKTCRCGRKI